MCLSASRHTVPCALTSPQVLPINPVKPPLPHAPHFKLYCMYGVGTPTERGYHYLKSRRGGATEWSINGMVNDPASGLVSFRSFQRCLPKLHHLHRAQQQRQRRLRQVWLRILKVACLQ